MNKREIIEGLLDEFELLVTQYQYELSKSDDENDARSRMTSEAIRVTRQRIVNESQSLDLDVVAGYNEMRADLINRAEAGDARASALLVQVDTRCRPRKMYQLTEATTALSTDRQSGCSNESTKDGSRE